MTAGICYKMNLILPGYLASCWTEPWFCVCLHCYNNQPSSNSYAYYQNSHLITLVYW